MASRVTFHASRFTNSATLNDWAEITELTAAKILVEVDGALLFFCGGRDVLDWLRFGENLRLDLLRDMILLQFWMAIVQPSYSLSQLGALGAFRPYQRDWQQNIDDNVRRTGLSNQCGATLRDAFPEMGVLYPVTGRRGH